jgi:hypothetical protein
VNWSALTRRLSAIERRLPPPRNPADDAWDELWKRAQRSPDFPTLIGLFQGFFFEEVDSGISLKALLDPEVPAESLPLKHLTPAGIGRFRAFIAGETAYSAYLAAHAERRSLSDRPLRSVGTRSESEGSAGSVVPALQ